METTKDKTIEKKISYLFPLILGPFTFLLFGPIEMVTRNSAALWFSWIDVIHIIIVAFLVCFAILLLIVFFLPRKIQRYYIAVIWGIGFALYIQGNIIQVDYGILDGSAPVWDEYRIWAIINTLIWIVLLVLPTLTVRFWHSVTFKLMGYITFVLLTVQIVSAITVIVQNSPTDDASQQLIVTADLNHTVSDNQNIVVFVLDSFDVYYMNTFLEEEPQIKDLLDGFVFFDNVLGMFNYTVVGAPIIYTGKPFLNETLYLEYLDMAWKGSPIYPLLREKNFITNLYIPNLISPLVVDLIDNVHHSDGWVMTTVTGMANSLFRFVGVRYFPHIIKSPVWMYISDFDKHRISTQGYIGRTSSLDMDFRFHQTLLNEGLVVISDKNMFSMFHLNGPHTPIIYDRNVQPATPGVTTLTDQARGSLQIVLDYIEQMKEVGVYDDTLIVITADHGQYERRQAPAMLIREPHATGQLQISHLPLSKLDVMPMLVSFVQDQISPMTFFQNTTADRDTRNFFFLNTEAAIIMNPGARYSIGTGDIYEFEFGIESTRWDVGRFVGVRSAIQDAFAVFPEVRLNFSENFVMNFAEQRMALFFDHGDVRITHSGAFSANNTAVFRATVLDFPQDTDLIFELLFNVIAECPTHRRQRIRLYVNDYFLDERTYHIYQQNIYDVFYVPNTFLNDDNSLAIRLEFLDALEHIDSSEDVLRNITAAINLREITFRTADDFISRASEEFNRAIAPINFDPSKYTLGEILRFGGEGNGIAFFAKELQDVVGAGFARAIGYHSVFGVRFDEPITSDLILDTSLSVVVSRDEYQVIRLYADGEYLYEQRIHSDGVHNASFIIPADAISPEGELFLVFHYPYAITPIALGINNDTNFYSIDFRTIQITNIESE